MPYIIVGLVILIGFLLYKLYQKQKIDKSELEHYKAKLEEERALWEEIKEAAAKIRGEYEENKAAAEYEKYKLEECKKDLQAALGVYQDITDNKLKEIDDSMEE